MKEKRFLSRRLIFIENGVDQRNTIHIKRGKR